LSYLISEPERGDIVIFKFPDDESQKFIKRIIGLPGEKVVIEDGKIYINDAEVPLEETYLKEEWVVGTGPYEFNVPEGCYFVMGDNRNDSNDARFWDNTYVTAAEIIGKAEFIYYPFNHIKSLR
jgi:signal peptidase I